eukprot:scaffold1428_cov351-Prasinococcus_capsulatus_cf.AAC.1
MAVRRVARLLYLAQRRRRRAIVLLPARSCETKITAGRNTSLAREGPIRTSMMTLMARNECGVAYHPWKDGASQLGAWRQKRLDCAADAAAAAVAAHLYRAAALRGLLFSFVPVKSLP